MTKLLWMTIDRHPDSLKALIRNQLSDTGWEVFEVSYDSVDSLASVPLESIDAVLLAPARHFPAHYMDRLTACRLMQIWSSGYDKFNIHDAHSRRIPVANNHGSNAVSVAEHTILMMLGVSRRAPEMHNRVVTGNWAGNDHGMTSYSVAQKTLGIVGLGNIGTLVAVRAEALGMRVLFADPFVETSPVVGWEKQTFEQVLAESDYISFHVHLEPSTEKMLNLANIHLLGKQPFLINVSRAELVERDALLFALRSQAIRGIALDAHYQEPTAEDDQLLHQQNGFFSPHTAGSTADSYKETLRACKENIVSALKEEPIEGILAPTTHA